MIDKIQARALNATHFHQFGDVVEVQPHPTMMINEGNCARYHDLAKLDFIDAKAGISLFQAQPCKVPYCLKMMERHPLGSQAFLPLSNDPFLVVVAEDEGGFPALPQAFVTNGQQGVNYHRNVWHAVLTPLSGSGLFAVIDRIGGEGENLQESWFEQAYQILV